MTTLYNQQLIDQSKRLLKIKADLKNVANTQKKLLKTSKYEQKKVQTKNLSLNIKRYVLPNSSVYFNIFKNIFSNLLIADYNISNANNSLDQTFNKVIDETESQYQSLKERNIIQMILKNSKVWEENTKKNKIYCIKDIYTLHI